MIDTSKLTKRDVGREVVLTTFNHLKYNGTIISWNVHRKWIYVKYKKCQEKWENAFSYESNNTTGIRTGAGLLEFDEPLKLIDIVTRWELMILDD